MAAIEIRTTLTSINVGNNDVILTVVPGQSAQTEYGISISQIRIRFATDPTILPEFTLNQPFLVTVQKL